MATLGSRAKTVPIYVKQGSDWKTEFWFTLNNVPTQYVNLAGSSFAGAIRRSKSAPDVAAVFTFTLVLDTDRDRHWDKVRVELLRAVSSPMVCGEKETDPLSKYLYDWEWTNSDGTVDRFQEGPFVLSREVTR